MKCNFQNIFANICKNSNIDNIWVLDANHTDYFKWDEKGLPTALQMADAEKICVAAAAQAELDNSTGVCVFPSTSTLLESLAPLYELNRSRSSLLVACVVDDYDMTPESMFMPLLQNADLFVQVLTEAVETPRMILHCLQYAVAENRVAILLIGRHLLSKEARYNNTKRAKSYESNPVILPPQHKLEELASLLNQYEKITILCGKHCVQAIPEIESLSKLLLSPVAFNPGLRAPLAGNVSYPVGIYGHWAQRAAYEAIGSSELLLLLDYSQKNFCEFGDKVKIIQISPFSLSGVDQEQTKRIYRGDIKNTLINLLPLIQQKKDTTFVDHLVKKHQEHEKQIYDPKGAVPEVLNKLAELLNNKLERNSCLCAEGYAAFFFQNILVDSDQRRFICHLDDLQGDGNTIFMAMGMLFSKTAPQVIGILDSKALLSQISCLLPLANPHYNIKIISFNTACQKKSELENLCKAMGIAYYQLNGTPDILVGVEHWLNYNHSSILEICVDVPSDLLIEVPSYRYGPIPNKLMKKVLDSLNKLNTGTVFCQGDTISSTVLKSEEGRKICPLYSSRNVFYAAIGAESAEERIGVCIASNLHEVLSMVPGIYEAKRHHLPILFLVFINTMECKQRIIKEAFVIHKIVNTLSGYHQIADLHKDLNFIIGEAIAEAIQIRNIGSVLFQNIYELAEEPKCSDIFESPYIQSIEYPCEEELLHLASLINQASYPVIFAGGGCRKAAEEVLQLSQLIQAPLGWTFKSKDLFDDNPYPLGMPGLLCTSVLEDALKKCDLLLLLGIEFPFENPISKTATVVQIDINPTNLGLTHAVDIGLVGDIKPTLKQLLEKIEPKDTSGKFAVQCKEKYQSEYDTYLKAIQEKEKKLNSIIFEGVIERINQSAPMNAWITADMVIPWYLSSMILNSHDTRRFFSTGDNIYSCNSTAFALGADMENNQIPKVVITTNISFRKQIDNLRTVVREKSNLKIFVLHLWDEDPTIAYSRLFGFENSKGITITALDDLAQHISLIFNIPGFVIADIYTAKTALVKVPPLIPVLVNKHRTILENLYIDNGKNLYMQIFGLLPTELKDDEWQ